MKYIIAILIISISNLAYSESGNYNLLHKQISSNSEFKTTTSYLVSDKVIEKLNKWNPATDLSPPLSINEAVIVAKKSITYKNPQFNSLLPLRVSLEKIKTENIWYYIISFGDDKNGMRKFGYRHGTSTTAVVLMNGSVVKPKIIKKRHN